MRIALGLGVVVSITLTLWFVLGLGSPWRTSNPTGAWLWAAMSWVTVALDVLLLLVLLRVHISPWAALAVIVVQDTVWAWRLHLLYSSRRADRKGANDGR